MPTPTAAERLHAQQQKNRKAAGLPDPSEYKKKLDSMKSEEVEQLDEISPQLKASYVAGAKKQIKQSMPFTKKTDEYRDIAKNFIAKRQKGIAKANEEVEQLDEYESKGGVYKHTAKYVPTDRNEVTYREPHTAGRKLNKSRTSDADRSLGVKWGNGALYKAQSKKTLMNVHKNLPEEVEQLDEMPESNMKVRDVHSHLKKAGWSLARSKGGHDVFKHPKAKHSIPVPRHALKAPLVRGIMKASKVEEQLEKKGRFVSGPIKQPFKSNTIVTAVKEEVEKLDEMVVVKTNKPIGTRVADIGPGGKEYNVKTDKAWDDSKKKQPQGADFAAQRRKERLAKSGRMDEKENLPGLWANIRAKKARGESPAKPGDKDYPKDLETVRAAGKKSVEESAAEPTEGEMKGKQGYSRKAQIVMNAAKGKKSDSPDKFQKDPELSSEIHKT